MTFSEDEELRCIEGLILGSSALNACKFAFQLTYYGLDKKDNCTLNGLHKHGLGFLCLVGEVVIQTFLD